MAKTLGLDISNAGDGIKVSWNDVVANDQSKSAGILIPIVAFVAFILAGGMILGGNAGGGFALLGMVLVGTIVGAIWFRAGSTTVRNSMTFSAEKVSHKGRSYPTDRVTRFEYGMKSNLTGITPKKDGHGDSMSDPVMIRMWVDDSAPITITENNWEFGINHEIRDTLDNALKTVRQHNKQKQHEKEYGKTGDFGMPDY